MIEAVIQKKSIKTIFSKIPNISGKIPVTKYPHPATLIKMSQAHVFSCEFYEILPSFENVKERNNRTHTGKNEFKVTQNTTLNYSNYSSYPGKKKYKRDIAFIKNDSCVLKSLLALAAGKSFLFVSRFRKKKLILI